MGDTQKINKKLRASIEDLNLTHRQRWTGSQGSSYQSGPAFQHRRLQSCCHGGTQLAKLSIRSKNRNSGHRGRARLARFSNSSQGTSEEAMTAETSARATPHAHSTGKKRHDSKETLPNKKSKCQKDLEAQGLSFA